MHTTGNPNEKRRIVRRAGILIFWLLLWQAVSVLIQNNILFVGPLEVARALLVQLGTGDFWKTLAFSLKRISLGFFLAFFSGIALGSFSFKFSFLQELLSPLLLFFKSIPVASFVILALMWMGAKNLSVFISYMVALPIIYTATLTGLRNTDQGLLEMARVFRLSRIRTIRAVYLPALLPYLRSSADSALGLGIKSGVAAEVIGTPDFSIGAQLYTAKIYLSTADLFAWTLVIILAAWLLEKLLLMLFDLANPTGKEKNYSD